MYIYPENLKAKARLWLWELRDVAILGGAVLLSVIALARGGTLFPLVCAAVYAFLTIRTEDASILDFLRYATRFLFLQPQRFDWRERMSE